MASRHMTRCHTHSDWSGHLTATPPFRRWVMNNEGGVHHSAPVVDGDDDAYILLLLADSNLPTGSFVASSGLESFFKHGFTSTIDFVRDSLHNYAHTSLPFVSDAHRLVDRSRTDGIAHVLSSIVLLDSKYDEITLNHVARRASKSQGVALLTLYTKAFSSASLLFPVSDANPHHIKIKSLIDQLKTLVRKQETHGHLPICWGLLTAALGLTLGLSFLPLSCSGLIMIT
jgi:urease accessory protein